MTAPSSTRDGSCARRFAGLARAGVESMPVYEPGRPIEEVARELGLGDSAGIEKLASNENALGPSPRAVEAMRAAAARMHLYPDGGAYYLKQALSERLRLPPDHLVITNGSNEAIELLGHVFLQPGRGVVMADRAFIVYRLVAALFGADTTAVPMREYTHDLDAMADAVTGDTRLVFVANPNNPTGTMVSGAALDRFLDRLPDHVVPVLDEAYIELVAEDHRPPSLDWVRAGRPVVVVRTFSKAYGLAGLRIGYAAAPPEAIALLQRVRQPFNVNAMALEAAVAALGDDAFLGRSRALVRDGLLQLAEGCERLGLRFVPSVANFLLVEVGDGRRVFERLQARGVIVRPMNVYGLPEFVRVTVGTREQNRRLLAELELVRS